MRIGLVFFLLTAISATTCAQETGLADFNRALSEGTRNMDDAALAALWSDDGVSLLPGTQPLVGKAAISDFIHGQIASFPHAKVKSFDLECQGIEVSGDWASEWCNEHQVVDMGNGKEPFDGRGRLLFVLKRNTDGHWRLMREMWVPS